MTAAERIHQSKYFNAHAQAILYGSYNYHNLKIVPDNQIKQK